MSAMDAQATDWQRWRERLGYVAAMVVFGWVGGLIVGWFSNDPDGVRQWLAGDLPTFPISMARAPWDAFFYGTIYSVAIWTACLWAAAQAHRFVPLRSWRAALVHVFWVTLAGSTAFTLVYWMDPVFCHLLGLGDKSIDERPPFGVVLSVCAGAMLIACLIMYAMGFYRQLRTAEEAVLKAELKALRAQVNPHFLFNTLNSIAALVHARPDDAERMTERLANLFRYTLRSSEQPVVTLAEDLQATQTYIAIEQVRFRERMVVQVDVPERLHQARVPSLMLQPLVENAVKYGVANAEDACAIRIR
ncbi:MAG: histidine kinase, partial [Bacteroidota bacterium]